jgi:hypothetical protein
MSGPDRRSLRLIRLALVTLMATIIAGCSGDRTPAVAAGIDGCASCGMVIDRVNVAAGWFDGGEFVPFCSPGCLLSERDGRRKTDVPSPQQTFFADYHSGQFTTAVETAFLLTDHIPTVMNARVICFASLAAAEEMRSFEDEVVTDWTGYRVQRGQPDAVVETVFSSGGMEPEVVAVNKGDIVLWRSTGDGLTADLEWIIKGYPEVHPPIVSTSGEPIELRFMASRPGAGFPIECRIGGQPLGMLKVSGAHTLDEAAQ